MTLEPTFETRMLFRLEALTESNILRMFWGNSRACVLVRRQIRKMMWRTDLDVYVLQCKGVHLNPTWDQLSSLPTVVADIMPVVRESSLVNPKKRTRAHNSNLQPRIVSEQKNH